MQWTDLVAIALVAVAAFFLARRLKRNFDGHGDGSCDKCVPKDAPSLRRK